MSRPYRMNVAREVAMARMYADGQTLQQIGDHFGLTRERVRQLISRHGMNRKTGGSFKRGVDNAKRREQAAKARRDARAIFYYGCTHAELLALNNGESPRAALSNAGKFRQQKNNSIARGLTWTITFPQWMQVWLESGHWDERGRTRNSYVMARCGDTGGYALGNVYITTLAQNVSDYQATLKRRGVRCSDGYKRLPEMARKKKLNPTANHKTS